MRESKRGENVKGKVIDIVATIVCIVSIIWGIYLCFFYKVADKTEVVEAYANVEDYRYQIRMDDVNVGGSAQTTAALGITVRPMKGLRLGLDWNFASRLYADYDIEADLATPGKEYQVAKPWEVPSYNTFDLNAGYTFEFGKVTAILSGNVNNLFNQEYIADAWDGTTWEDATVFYGFGRTYSVGLKIKF